MLACLLILLLQQNAQGFLAPSTNLPCQRFVEGQPLRGGSVTPLSQAEPSSSSSKNSENDDIKSNNSLAPPVIVTRFLKAFYKGVTFPFPTLRNLALESPPSSSTSEDKSKQTKIGFSLRESLLAIFVYLIVGAVSYHSTVLQVPATGKAPANSWSFVDAIYFSVVTFTTVGYGDLCPTTNLGKIFTILFGLSGISILGIAIGTIGSKLVAMESEMMNNAKEASQRRVLGFWHAVIDDNNPGDKSGIKNGQSGESGTSTAAYTSTTNADSKNGPLWKHTLTSLLKKSIPAFAVLILGGIGMGRLEGWSLLDSTYYAFITALTLGYGDFSPVSKPGRLWATIFIPLAVAAAGEVLGNVATTLQERRQNQFYESLMQRELNTERLLAMDTDKDGKVSREEYVAYMLQEMELVNEEEFAELHEQFAKLDVDGGGFLNKRDIQLRLEKQNASEQ